MYIMIGGAWPYANGPLHIGHIAALLPGDILARYHRQKGDAVNFVSGTDCHGTPVTIRAKNEGLSPEIVSDRYHEEFVMCFDALGFSYDMYGKTSSPMHKEFIKGFHEKMYQNSLIYEKESKQAYCSSCANFLPDRFVVGRCPNCNEKARGDQCEACGLVLEPELLFEPSCVICGDTPIRKKTKHLYLAITRLKDVLEEYVKSHVEWRKNAYEMSMRYINEGLRDRAITRDLDWGIDVPRTGYEGKKIYIWAENVLGYLSSGFIYSVNTGMSFIELWGEKARHYYVHGKDNIPFHTIILPSLLIANASGYRLPDRIISSEYLTLEGRKISTSENHAIWIRDLIKQYDPDPIRYFLIANGPEKRDTDFSWREFIKSNNTELLGAYGNLINRTLVFIQKKYNSIVPKSNPEASIKEALTLLYRDTGNKIENGEFKAALESIFEFVRNMNKYYDEKKPWITLTQDPCSCGNTIYNCTNAIANLSVLLFPFLPFSSQKVFDWLKLDTTWGYKEIDDGIVLEDITILFTRLDQKTNL